MIIWRRERPPWAFWGRIERCAVHPRSPAMSEFYDFRSRRDRDRVATAKSGSDINGEKNNDLPDDRCSETLSQTMVSENCQDLYVAFARFCGILILDNHSRMRFLDSAHRRRVSRRENAVELGLRAKFVVFFSVAIGSPDLIRVPSRQVAKPRGPRGNERASAACCTRLASVSVPSKQCMLQCFHSDTVLLGPRGEEFVKFPR